MQSPLQENKLYSFNQYSAGTPTFPVQTSLVSLHSSGLFSQLIFLIFCCCFFFFLNNYCLLLFYQKEMQLMKTNSYFKPGSNTHPPRSPQMESFPPFHISIVMLSTACQYSQVYINPDLPSQMPPRARHDTQIVQAGSNCE